MIKNLRNFSRLFVGLLFVFSGLIKANDPLGFGYKLQEYFEVFHCVFLNDYAPAIAIAICAAEIVLGALLLLGFWARYITCGLVMLIIFFTFLTFYSAFFEVVSSCGCFGDAIPLTPWQSFAKDLVLLLFIGVIFFYRSHLKPVINADKVQRILSTIIVCLALGFGLYTYNYSPVIDFLPYKVGNNIPQLMQLPAGAKLDVYETMYTLKNKTSGESKQMTDKEYLKTEIWKDTTWVIYGDPKVRLVSKGYEIPIKDLKIADAHGVDYTSEIIEHPYYNLVVVAYELEKANLHAIGNVNALAINAAEHYNIKTVLLTATSPATAELFAKTNKIAMPIFYADAVPLKSMVRANPGILLLKDGVVIQKWHYHSLPSYQEFQKKYFDKN